MVTTSQIEINPELLKTISKIAKKENTTEKRVLNEVIEKGIEVRNINKIPEHLILNKDTYNPDPERMEKMIGIIEAPPGFDPVKAVREVRLGE